MMSYKTKTHILIDEMIEEYSEKISNHCNDTKTNVKDIFLQDTSLEIKFDNKEHKKNLANLFVLYIDSVSSRLAKKYNTECKNILEILGVSSVKIPEITVLSRMTVAELKELCKKIGHKVSGKKDELIMRITGMEKIKSEPSVEIQKITVPRKIKKEGELKTVIKNIRTPQIVIKKNKYNNYVHTETNLVFNPETKKVIGVQLDNGDVEELTDVSIQLCKQYKFDFILPQNLDKYGTLDAVVIKELEDLKTLSDSEGSEGEDDDISSMSESE